MTPLLKCSGAAAMLAVWTTKVEEHWETREIWEDDWKAAARCPLPADHDRRLSGRTYKSP